MIPNSYCTISDFVALGIPKGDACYQRDARRYFRSTIKINWNLFCIVLAYSYLCKNN